MTLATHIVIAAAAAKPITSFHPAFSFLTAYLSHYLADAIPHWDYGLNSMRNHEDPDKRRWEFRRESLLKDLTKVILDGALGTTALLLATKPSSPTEFLWIGAVIAGGILPDFLEGVYIKLKIYPLRLLHKFHRFMHTKVRLKPYPLIGVPLQIIFFLIALYLLV